MQNTGWKKQLHLKQGLEMLISTRKKGNERLDLATRTAEGRRASQRRTAAQDEHSEERCGTTAGRAGTANIHARQRYNLPERAEAAETRHKPCRGSSATGSARGPLQPSSDSGGSSEKGDPQPRGASAVTALVRHCIIPGR